jgi:NADPH-dependent glutamate synthase beta subunit-like oxidoreductase
VNQTIEPQIVNYNREITTYESARCEAARCLGCLEAPCQEACPVHIPIPKVHYAITTGNLRYAAELVRTVNPMAHTCGACCPQETFCQSVCLRASLDHPLNIRDLHRFATNWEWGHNPRKPINPALVNLKVAIIGGGPAGLACAVGLGRYGIRSDLYENEPEAGGIPNWGIPQERLPREIPQRDVEGLSGYPVSIYSQQGITSLHKLSEQYDAVFIATGNSIDGKTEISGQDGPGVIGGLEFLRKAKRIQIGIREPIRIIGGGNVAVDCALVANNLGANRISVIYRRHRAELPAWTREVDNAFHRGVEFLFLLQPVAIEREGDRISRLICRRMTLGLPGEDGRREPIPLPGETVSLETGMVIVATGQTPQRFQDDTLQRDDRGNILVDECGRTNLPKVYAGGDVTGKGGTVVEAVHFGLHTAKCIKEDIVNNGNNPFYH